MKKIVLLTFALILFSTAVVVRFISPVVSYPTETEVLMEVDLPVHNIDSGKNFSTIQEAINDDETSDGHTILVDAGTYYEHVTINKSLMIIGEDRATTIIDAGWKDTVVSVTTDNVTVSGFTIRNAGGYLFYACIELGASRITVKDNIITASYIGIFVGGDHNTIINNTIVATGGGMVLHRSRGTILRNNEMIDNDINFAIGGESLSDFFLDIDTSNLVDGRPIYYLVNQSNLIVNSSTYPDIGYLAVVNSTKVTVEDLELRTRNHVGILLAYTTHSIIQNLNISNSDGVSLYASSHNKIIGNRISDNYHGISLFSSNNNEVIDNEISSDSLGINLASSEGNEIKDNVIRASRDVGIYVGESNCNVINNNVLLENNCGIRLGRGIIGPEPTGNLIVGNLISNNNYGLGLFSGCKDNFVISNTIKNNTYGIHLHIARNNIIYHNNFINNTHQVYDDSQVFPITPSINTWDDGYPSGGNYWSNYTGVDVKRGPYQNVTGSDGIGDTPHEIDANNQDRYPLIVPVVWNYSNPIPVVWQGATCSVALSSNSTILTFKFNQTQMQISFDVTGPSGTIGFCNVTIPKSLLKGSPWTVTIDGQPPIDFIPTDNATHAFLYFTYTHASTSHVIIQGTEVIPEFPTWTSVLLILILLTVATAIYKRRLLKTPIH